MEDAQLLVEQADQCPYLHQETEVQLELAGPVHGLHLYNHWGNRESDRFYFRARPYLPVLLFLNPARHAINRDKLFRTMHLLKKITLLMEENTSKKNARV